MRNEKILNRIIIAAEVNAHDRILEIGPGKGVLTEQLFTYADKLGLEPISLTIQKQIGLK